MLKFCLSGGHITCWPSSQLSSSPRSNLITRILIKLNHRSNTSAYQTKSSTWSKTNNKRSTHSEVGAADPNKEATAEEVAVDVALIEAVVGVEAEAEEARTFERRSLVSGRGHAIPLVNRLQRRMCRIGRGRCSRYWISWRA